MKTKALIALLLLGAIAPTRAVKVAWDPNPEPEVIGYRIHWGRIQGRYTTSINVGDTLGYEYTAIPHDVTIWSVVTAYNAAGLESFPSNEISFTDWSDENLRLVHEGARWYFNLGTGQYEIHVAYDTWYGKYDYLYDSEAEFLTHHLIVHIDQSTDLVEWEEVASDPGQANYVVPHSRRMFYRARIEKVLREYPLTAPPE